MTSLTGITTLLILFWALNESKRNNKILITRNTYNDFYSIITEFDAESKKKLFYSLDISIQEVFKIHQDITYYNVSMYITDILNKIKKTIDEYREMHFLEESNVIPRNHLSYFFTLEEALTMIKFGFVSYELFISRIADFFVEIDSSDLENSEKQILIKRLSRITYYYSYFCKNVNDNVFDKQSIDTISKLSYYKILNENEKDIFKPIGLFIGDDFYNSYDKILKVQKKYLSPKND